MHHHLVVKIHASNLDDAKSEVQSIAEESVTPENNSCGWDYVEDIERIVLGKATKGQISIDEYDVKTFEELDKKLMKEFEDDGDKENLQRHFTELLAPKYLHGKEAPTYLGTDDERITILAEKAIQSGNEPVLPKTFRELVDFIVQAVAMSIEKDDMIPYYIKKIEESYQAERTAKNKENKIQTYGDAYEILQCTDAPFMEMWSSSINLKKPIKKDKMFYFVVDRHY
jgi:hypothetical protein